MLSIGKQFTFDAAHFIEDHPQCGVMHGHTWTLDVMLNNCQRQSNGMVVDFHVLSGIVKDVLRVFDHKVINDVVTFKPVTAETLVEHLCACIHRNLEFVAPGTKYGAITCRLQEGFGGWAEFTMEVLT